MSDIDKLTNQIIKFRDKRDWKQFHSPKDSSMALVSEAVEVLDELKFKNDKQIADYLKKDKSKMKENEKKYPVEKSKGSNIKYTDL